MNTLAAAYPAPPRAARPRPGRRARQDRRLALLLLLPSAVIMVALVGIPFVHIVIISLERVDAGDLSGPFIGLGNFLWALRSADFHDAFLHSLAWTLGTVAVELAVGLGFALLLDQRFFLRNTVRVLVLVPYMMPMIVAVLIWRYMLHDLIGVVNYLLIRSGIASGPILWLDSPQWVIPSLIGINVWKHFPFSTLVFLAALQTVPPDQYEAARLDGASALQQFRYITLPTLMPVILITALLRAIYAINSFDLIYLLTGGGPGTASTTMPLLVYTEAFIDSQMGRAAACALLMFVAMLVVFWFYERAERNATARL